MISPLRIRLPLGDRSRHAAVGGGHRLVADAPRTKDAVGAEDPEHAVIAELRLAVAAREIRWLEVQDDDACELAALSVHASAQRDDRVTAVVGLRLADVDGAAVDRRVTLEITV